MTAQEERIVAMENECIDIIENFGDGMSRQDAVCVFALVKNKVLTFWETEYGH